MFPMAPLLWLLLTCSTLYCPHVPNHALQISSTQAIPSDLLITLERTGCEGVCPMYTLKIFADGRVVYRGKLFVRNRRRVESKLTQEALRQLLAEFEKTDYFSLRDRYQYWEDGCPGGAMDYPSAITSIRINGRAKITTHDYGCREKSQDGRPGPVYPKELFALEQRIDEIVGTTRWTNSERG
jgi:hypothetical protein